MDITIQRKSASEQSLGSSSEKILESITHFFKKENLNPDISILDLGCGKGKLLKTIKNLGFDNLNGIDFSEFEGFKDYNFFTRDFNLELNVEEKYDVIISSEVVEHLENPRHFFREIKKILKDDGILLLTTPNPESLLSIITFFIKGYHNAFGPKNYPAHITPLSSFDMKNIINETELKLESIEYINNGRIPGTSIHWQKILPMLKGKRFSDNYFIIARKV